MNYYVLAGERSGDQHAARLVEALKRRDPSARVRAWGGDALQAAGAELVYHYRAFSVMGFAEVARALPKYLRLLKEVEADLLAHRPDVLILVDFAGFNLRVARIAKKHGIRVFYYISPKLWAWAQGRARTVAATVDRMFLILPFETEFYAGKGFTRTDYVGNPVADSVALHQPDAAFRQRHGLPPEQPLIAVLPGSRRQEVQQMLGVMMAVVGQVPDHLFIVAGVSNLDRSLYGPFEGKAPNVRFIFDDTYNLLSNARAALVTSGTATLETALFGVPEVVCYATSALSYWISRMLIKVKYISLVNLIVGREVVPELIQQEMTSNRMLAELKPLLADDHPKRQAQLAGYAELRRLIGQPGAPDKAAELMVNYLAAKDLNSLAC